VEQQKSPMNQAVAAEIRAERGAQRMTVKQLALASGMVESTLNRALAGERDINVTQLTKIAAALGTTPDALMTRAVDRMGGIDVLMSDVRRKNVTPLRRVEDMTVDEIEAEQKKAATIDPEMDTDEQFD
jgi:transcriptional regulator with XRE-family HTH domain